MKQQKVSNQQYQDRLALSEGKSLKQQRRSNNYNRSQRILEGAKMFRLICKGNHMALRTQIRQKKLAQDQLRIIGGIENSNSIKQLWLLNQIKDNKFQIVNFATDLVMECDEASGIKLQKGKQKYSQKFQMQEVNKNIKNFRDSSPQLQIVRIKDNNNYYLVLDNLLELAKLDQGDENQIFYKKRVNPAGFRQFQQTCIILNPEGQKCLDVARGEEAIGTQVVLFRINYRANQRWYVQPPIQKQAHEDVKYSIVNMLTGLRLWYDRKKGLIQSDNSQRIWQLHKKHNNSGQLYQAFHKKYLNRVQQDKLSLENNPNGTKWEFL